MSLYIRRLQTELDLKFYEDLFSIKLKINIEKNKCCAFPSHNRDFSYYKNTIFKIATPLHM